MDRDARLRRILASARRTPLYGPKLDGVDLDRVDAADLSALPFTTREELVAAFDDDPTGGFARAGASLMHLTPAPGGRVPEFLTPDDERWQAEAVAAALERAGLRAGMRVMVVFSYHMLAGGWLLHAGLQRLGATVLPQGPGDAASVAEILERFAFDALVANPTFARKIAQAGGRVGVLVASGEPFTAVPGYREAVEAELGCTAFDAYATSEAGVVAMETAARDGLEPIPEACIVEVVDPATGAPVATGEKGELVLTSLTREAMPLVRFRSGDLTLRGERDGRMHLPRGVFGRTDSMVKVKGVKVYPKELLFLIAGSEGLDFRSYQLVLRRNDDGTDHATLRVAGDPDVDTSELAERVRRAVGIGMNEIRVEPEVEGDLVVDERF